jgi:hypothetical protein
VFNQFIYYRDKESCPVFALCAFRTFLQLFPFRFTEGTKSIQINGLVWMGEAAFMKQQIEEKKQKDLPA